MAETIYETTIANYETVIGALPANSTANPYTVKITDIENLENSSLNKLNTAIKNSRKFVNIIWSNGSLWSETNINIIFDNCDYIISVDATPFSNAIVIGNMFLGCKNLKTFDTSPLTNLTKVSGMFINCTGLTSINTSGFINVIEGFSIFYGCTNLTSIDTTCFSNLELSSGLFANCTSLTSINVAPFVKLRTADSMFAGCTNLTSIINPNFTNVTSANGMFYGCTNLTSIDTSSFSKLNDASFMFYGCTNLTSIINPNFTNVTKSNDMFADCSNLTFIDVTLLSKVTDAYLMFDNCRKLTCLIGDKTSSKIEKSIPSYVSKIYNYTTIANYETNLSGFPQNTVDTPYTIKITDIENLTSAKINEHVSNLGEAIKQAGKYVNIVFPPNATCTRSDNTQNFCELTHLVSIDITPFRGGDNFLDTFYGCSNLKNVEINSNFSNARNIGNMFGNCKKITSIDTTRFTNVTNASYLFDGCSSLEEVDLSTFTNVTNAKYLFRRCSSLKIIDTTPLNNVTNTEAMFSDCTGLTSINVTPLTNTTNSKDMFSGCTGLTSIDISVFDKVTNAQNMFANCTGLTDVVISDMSKNINSVVAVELPSNVTDVYFPNDHKSFGPDYEVYLEPYSTLQNKTLHYVLSDIYPKSTTLANYARNVSSLDVNNSSTPYDIKITDFKEHVATDFSTAIIGGDRFVNLTFDDDTYEFDDATCMFEDCTKIVSLDITPFIDIAIGDFMFHNVPIPTLDETLFTKLTSANNMFDGTGKVNFDFTNAKDLEEVTVPSSAKKFFVNDTALERIDLSEASNLEYLDVSNTNITSLNLIHCSSLPYCEWNTINDEKVLIKGWLAKNCTSLLTVKATETQVQDANLNLMNDTNALEGCTALQEVEVACNSRPSYSGNEVHYGTVKFENEVVFNNGLSLGEQALKDIFNICHPIGEKYVQLGGEKYPWEMYPLTKKVDWENISNQYANEFFRVAGGEKPMGYFLTEDTEIVAGKTYYTRSGKDPNYTYTAVASPVVANIRTYYELSTNLTASTINNGDSDYLHITQNEGIPNIRGEFVSATALDRKVSDGAFEKEDYSSSSTRIGRSGSDVPHEKYKINAAIGEVKSDGTFRNDVFGKSDHLTPYNSAIQIWRRIS